MLKRTHLDFTNQTGVFERLIDDQWQQLGDVRHNEMNLVSDCGIEGVKRRASVVDIRIPHHRSQNLNNDRAKVLIERRIGQGEDVAEGKYRGTSNDCRPIAKKCLKSD